MARTTTAKATREDLTQLVKDYRSFTMDLFHFVNIARVSGTAEERATALLATLDRFYEMNKDLYHRSGMVGY